MKFVKRSIYLLLAIAMVFSFNFAIEYETLAIEKMNDELMEIMSWVSDTTPFSVMIELKDKVPQDKLQKALDEVYKEYDMDTFYASEKNYIGNDKAYEEDYPELLAHYDAYAAARMKALASFYYPHNYAFLEKYDLEVDKEECVGSGVPYIHNVVVNKEIVNKMLYDSDVVMVAFYSAEKAGDCTGGNNISYTEVGDNVSDAMQYVRGDINDLGVTGNGIKVGLIEEGTPDRDILQNVTNLNIWNPSEHATQTSYIIRLLSPNCYIYSYNVCSPDEDPEDLTTAFVTAAFEALSVKGVHVINMSYARTSSSANDQNLVTQCIDRMIQQYNIPFVVATGNACTDYISEDGPLSDLTNVDYRISMYAGGNNSIAVGGMSAPGTAYSFKQRFTVVNITTHNGKWNQPGNMELYLFSCWKEASSSTPNKPDLVAPAGLFSINESNKLLHGTSFAAPHVTSTIAWMLARNVYMQGKTEQIKAAVIGSAYTRGNVIKKAPINDFNHSTIGSLTFNWDSDLEMNQNATEDYRGAGVLNAAYCYNVAYLGQRAEFTFTSEIQTKTYNVSVTNRNQPFRIAIAWESNGTSQSTRSAYTISIRKQGSSTDIPGIVNYTDTLYQAITLTPEMIQQYGTGTYVVTISVDEYVYEDDRVVGMTWNTINPLGYAPFNAQ